MRRLLAITVILLAWAATGLFIVRGNERCAVRRFGRLVTDASGRAALRSSGLHCDLPWPLARVDRLTVHELRTLTVGATATDCADGAFLREVQPADRSQFLTGDKNILHVRAEVQYRLSEDGAADYLFQTVRPERRLEQLTEAALTELITASGVDYVHTRGRAELQERLTERLRAESQRQRLGLFVETASLDDVRPPLRVKAAFLDVNDARADREKLVQTALAHRQQRDEQARGEDRRLRDQAETEKQWLVESARGASDRFTAVVAQLRAESERTGQSYAAVRRLALRRRWFEDVESILRSAATKIVLETGQQTDITILRPPAK